MLNRMKASILALAVCLVGSALLIQTDAHAAPPRYVVVVIDVSGSMNTARAENPGETRWDRAKIRAEEKINLFSAYNGDTFVSLWTFAGSGFVQHTNFQSPADALTALANIPRPGGATPLARTVCDAVTALVAATPNRISRILQLNSDGLENATPTAHPCFGPNSASDVAPYDPGSWQNNVYNQAQGVVVHVDVFNSSINFNGAGEADLEARGRDARLITARGDYGTSAVGTIDFFQSLASSTGGTFTVVADTQPAPVTGDVNDDFCVDDTDLDLVFSDLGLTVPPANPAHDLNTDGVVDLLDYLELFNLYGSGSGC